MLFSSCAILSNATFGGLVLLFAMGSFNKQTNKQTNKNIKIHCSIVLCAKPCEKKLPLKPRKERLGGDFVYSVPSFGSHIAISQDVTTYPFLVMARTAHNTLQTVGNLT